MQQRLDLPAPPRFAPRSPAGATIAGQIADWRRWPAGACALLIGPPSSGKSSLAGEIAAVDPGVTFLSALERLAPLPSAALTILDNADQAAPALLFDAINQTQRMATRLLLIARPAPSQWGNARQLRDLAARLSAAPVFALDEPPSDAAAADFVETLCRLRWVRISRVEAERIAFFAGRRSAALVEMVDALESEVFQLGAKINPRVLAAIGRMILTRQEEEEKPPPAA